MENPVDGGRYRTKPPPPRRLAERHLGVLCDVFVTESVMEVSWTRDGRRKYS